jgi:hypothetical protein
MAKLVLEYLFYLLNYVLLILGDAKWLWINMVCIIGFKIKNPPPVQLCWQKKRNPQNKFHFFGLAQPPAKI